MSTKRYSIYGENQMADTAGAPFKPVQNSAGQTVLFDGNASKEAIGQLTAAALLCYARVMVFRGRDVGRLVFDSRTENRAALRAAFEYRAKAVI